MYGVRRSPWKAAQAHPNMAWPRKCSVQFLNQHIACEAVNEVPNARVICSTWCVVDALLSSYVCRMFLQSGHLPEQGSWGS